MILAEPKICVTISWCQKTNLFKIEKFINRMETITFKLNVIYLLCVSLALCLIDWSQSACLMFDKRFSNRSAIEVEFILLFIFRFWEQPYKNVISMFKSIFRIHCWTKQEFQHQSNYSICRQLNFSRSMTIE